MHTPTRSPSPDRRFVDPEDLICPGCGEQVRCAPPEEPDGHGINELEVPQFSHPDTTALCRTPAGGVAEPVETPPMTGRAGRVWVAPLVVGGRVTRAGRAGYSGPGTSADRDPHRPERLPRGAGRGAGPAVAQRTTRSVLLLR